MEWDLLESAVRESLTTLSRIGMQIDSEQLLAATYDREPGWRHAPDLLKARYRALEALELLELAVKSDGFNLGITSLGREVLSSSDPILTSWFSDDPRLLAWAEHELLREAMYQPTASGTNRVERLEIHEWRQFAEIEIDFHPRLTILTGANGAGKTTLLNVLAPHFSWSAQLISASYSRIGVASAGAYETVGKIFYANGARTAINQLVAAGVRADAPVLPSMQTVPGIFISSHRSVSGYHELQNLPARFSTSNVLLSQFAGELNSRYLGQSGQYPPLYRMKEALVAAAMHGYGNRAVVADDEAREIWEGFQEILHKLLPRALAFEELQVEDATVFMKTNSSRFPLEAASGGLSALLELGWQVFLRGRESQAFTVCIDEPENHLHPEMQRSVIPALLDAFPLATFIVATHSPFVVTASTDCYVYALTPDARGIVTSRYLDSVNASASSDETLMAVLGLDTALPLWAERRLEAALEELPANPTVDQLRELRLKLVAAGLREQFPAALDALEIGPDA